MHESIGLLHPGEMGAAIGACLAGRGLTVLWASHGRSPATAHRAAGAGLTDAGAITDVVRQAGIIVSVCPPHAALGVARSVAGFRGIYADANAIAPQTARQVANIVTDLGASFVDGGIIGAPPRPQASTRLYLSGQRAAEVAALFTGTAVDARVIGDEPGAASALKMAYAAWTKGTAALLLAARALARAEGTERALLHEWAQSQPGLAERSLSAAESAVTKGWRWVGEMDEIAAAMVAHGLPEGFHRAAAEVFRRSPRLAPGTQAPPTPGTQPPTPGTQPPTASTQPPTTGTEPSAARSQPSAAESEAATAAGQALAAVLAALTQVTGAHGGDEPGK